MYVSSSMGCGACRPPALLAAVLLSVVAPLSAGNPVGDLPPGLAEHLIDPLTVETPVPFRKGEKLHYRIGWSFFTVARAELDVTTAQFDGKAAFQITLQARTNGFADAFYKVRNRSTSYAALDMSRAFEYNALQSEGGRERDTTARFDTTALTVRYTNNESGETRAPVPIMAGTFDPLSIVYFVRRLDFEVGDRLVIPTSNGKEFFFTVVDVTKKVKRKFLSGKREAFVLEPDIKDIGGVFKRSPNGRIRFYFSADEQKLPLRMESEVAVGKFWAELVDAEA